jgi:hypothetical protein
LIAEAARGAGRVGPADGEDNGPVPIRPDSAPSGSGPDRMHQRLAADAGKEVLDGELGHAAAGLDGGAAEVRGEDDLRQGQ